MYRTRRAPKLVPCLLAVALCAAVPAPARAATRYATVRHLCARPGPRRAGCLVLALAPAGAATPGARAYAPAAGALASGPAGGLTPAALASAYGFDPNLGGEGQTVALVDAYDDPNVEADLATFDGEYGLPACTSTNGCFEKVGQSGSASELPAADTRGWSVEIALDVEAVRSVCRSCRILLVEASSEGLGDLAAAVDEAVSLGASEVSNSYGALEGEMGPTEQAAYVHPGVVIAAAGGDSGWLNWDWVAERGFAPAEPDAPASLPGVVAVGGTALQLSSTGSRRSEAVWNDSGPPSGSGFKQFAATGGGCSALFGAPPWQQSAPGWAATGCGTLRLDNDVALVGDPYTGFDVYDSYRYASSFTPGWLTVGGTSLSSPLLAAMFGLDGGAHGIADPAATLYSHLGQAAALYDVSKRGNGFCDGEEPALCGEPEANELLGEVDCEGTASCDARSGFDGPAGVGAPKGLGAFRAPSQAKPTVTAGAVTGLEATAATLTGTVNPNGGAVGSCRFEWGTTTAYGSSAPCTPAPGAGSSPVAVSAPASGLAAATTYRWRLSATNIFGTTRHAGKAFTTP
jgi:hypothetical protein